MKKTWIISILTLIFVLALCGCQSTNSKSEDMKIDKETLVKAQEIQVTHADKSQVIAILSDKSEINNFINGFDWEN